MVRKGVCRLLRSAGFATLTEFTLVTGRRADVIGLNQQGAIWIIEIKSSPEDFRSDGKWPEYREYCDRLFFAIPQAMDPEIIPAETGLIVADHWGADILRHPTGGLARPGGDTLLHASRRKALTLAFARAAALRLHGLHDPQSNS